MSATDKAAELLRLHTDPELLVLVTVWDVASARVVPAQPGCKALATASTAIGASFGYPDGKDIPPRPRVGHDGFVPGKLDAPTTTELADALGLGKLSVLGMPGGPSPGELAALGVARVSDGPYSQ